MKIHKSQALIHLWEAVFRMSVLDAIEILGIVKQYTENISMFPDAIEKSKRVMNTLEVGLKEANNSKGGETQQAVVKNLKESLRRYKETLEKIVNIPLRCRLQPQKYSSKIEAHVLDVERQIPFLNISVLQKTSEIADGVGELKIQNTRIAVGETPNAAMRQAVVPCLHREAGQACESPAGFHSRERCQRPL